MVTKQSQVRLSDEDLEVIEELRKLFGLTKSGVIKVAIRELLQSRKDARNAGYTRKLL